MNGAQILGIFLVILVVVVICSSIRVVPFNKDVLWFCCVVIDV